MSSWLYPISSRSEYRFVDAHRRRHVASYENFRDFVFAAKTKDEHWHVSRNLKKIRQGDDLFVYTGDANRGIIAHGAITGKEIKTQSLVFRLHKGHTKQLLADPVPAALVRRFIPFPRSSVISIEPHIVQLRKSLPWRNEYRATSQILLSELRLKPISQTVTNIRGGHHKRWLWHDSVLGPVKTFLKANGFYVGTRSFRHGRVDVAACRKNALVIVEAKTIRLGGGRQEAREGLGQLLEYSWLFARENATAARTCHLWLAFSARPDHEVVEFLKYHSILASWPSKQGLSFSEQPSSLAAIEGAAR